MLFRQYKFLSKNSFLSTVLATCFCFVKPIILFVIRVIKSKRMRWVGHVARMGEKMGRYRLIVRKPEGKRPLGRTMCRWEDNIKMDIQEVGWGYGLD